MKSTSPSQSGSLFPATSRCVQQYASAEVRILANTKGGESSKQERGLRRPRHARQQGKKCFFFRTRGEQTPKTDWEAVVMLAKPTKSAKESVREGEAGKKAKATQHVVGKSVSEKSQATPRCTSKNLFEKCTHQEYVVDVEDIRMSKNGVEFFIGWTDFPNIKSLIFQVQNTCHDCLARHPLCGPPGCACHFRVS